MADLNQFLNQGLSADDIAHTNGYGAAAGSSGADGLSMEKRRQLLNQPRVVGAYQYSRLGRQGSSVKSRTADQSRGRVYDASSDSFADSGRVGNRQAKQSGSQENVTKSIERRQHYVEPPTRQYDRFG